MTTVYVQVKAVPVKLTIYGHRVDELIGAIHLADRLQEILLIFRCFQGSEEFTLVLLCFSFFAFWTTTILPSSKVTMAFTSRPSGVLSSNSSLTYITS